MEKVDSYRYLSYVTKKLVRAWIDREPRREIPWTELQKPLSECTVTLVSTAGIATVDDHPFDQEGERLNPWWGDPTYRVIPRDGTNDNVRLYHLHVGSQWADEDLDCVFPLGHLGELEEQGEIGASAARHYSYMGYILDPTELLGQTTPRMIAEMKADEVDVALLVPF